MQVPAICGSCGHVMSRHSGGGLVEKQIEKRNRNYVIGASLLFVIGFFQLVAWGSYAPEMRWLQLRDITGTASVQSMERMANICIELKKYNCIEYSYMRQSQIDKRKTQRYAEYQMTRHKFKEAAQSLGHYLKTAKNDIPALTLYARALGESGRIDDAISTYERAIAIQSRVLQQEVVQDYVRLLARSRRYPQAQAVILRMRRLHARAPRFMEKELRIISEFNTTRQIASKK